MQTCIFHLQNLSALHVGTGQGVGVVDLPIARAKATNLPIVPASGIKGVLRDELQAQSNLSDKDIKVLFGPNNQQDTAHAGAIAFGDAHLLILPIRSFAGTVAFATCPYILRQYGRDIGENFNIALSQKALISNDSLLALGDKIALEDLDINATKDEQAQQIAKCIAQNIYPQSTTDHETWEEQFTKRFVILPDDIFSFLADTATEIRTRIRIERTTRIVQNGALWTEENLPAETVLWGVIGISQSRDKHHSQSAAELAQLLPKEINIQIGGKHTVGRGFCRLLIQKTGE